MTDKLRVLYVIGKGRSGSTLADMLLGELDGWLSTGELWRVWQRGIIDHEPCGCGTPIHTCSVWMDVLDKAANGAGAEEIEALRTEVLRWNTAHRLWTATPEKIDWPQLQQLSAIFGRLYHALAAQTGARVIVDSSKWPLHPGLLGLIPGIEPYGLQLVRDPRAVAHSWKRKKRYQGSEKQLWMKRFPSWHSGLSWSARQLVCEAVKNRLEDRVATLRYETLVNNPADALRTVSALVGEPNPTLEFLDGNTARLGIHHTVGGNPDRFRSGPVELREDEKWKAEASQFDRMVLFALTGPLRWRYGYR